MTDVTDVTDALAAPVLHRLSVSLPAAAANPALTEHVARFVELFIEREPALALHGRPGGALVFLVSSPEDDEALTRLRGLLAESLFGVDDGQAVSLAPACADDDPGAEGYDLDASDSGPAAFGEPSSPEAAHPRLEDAPGGGAQACDAAAADRGPGPRDAGDVAPPPFADASGPDPLNRLRADMADIVRAFSREAADQTARRLAEPLEAVIARLETQADALPDPDRFEAAAARLEAAAERLELAPDPSQQAAVLQVVQALESLARGLAALRAETPQLRRLAQPSEELQEIGAE